MDPAHAAAMLAQMGGVASGMKMERSTASSMMSVNPLAAVAAAAAACMPGMPGMQGMQGMQGWPSPYGWHPHMQMWPGAINPYMNMMNPAAAAAQAAAAQAAAMNAAVSSAAASQGPILQPATAHRVERRSELPKKQRLPPAETESSHKSRAVEIVAKKSSCGPHSGTQRRPMRDEYEDEAEYSAAYQRWRQVRDRNNDAVKRSREKYKSKRKSNEPSTSRERDLEHKLGNVQGQMALLARALTAGSTMTPLEQAEVQLVLKATLARREAPSMDDKGDDDEKHANESDSNCGGDSRNGAAEHTSPIASDARVPAGSSAQAHSGADHSSASSACSSHHDSDDAE